jgi:NAD+ kinase
MPSFNTIGLIGRKGGRHVPDSLNTLLDFLAGQGCEICLEQETASLLGEVSAEVVPKEELAARCDLVIVVGGDGSMLGAARLLCQANIPVLGVNRGSLGFLTDISPNNIETKVASVLKGQFVREERFLLQAELLRGDESVHMSDALNEVVIHRGSSLRMIEFGLYIDGQFVYSQQSDGLIVSTPTGSTAYALSGGGPILHPSLEAIALVPMFPHTLTSRPIVVDAKCEIRVILGDPKEGNPQLSCDGQHHVSVQAGDTIRVTRKPHTLSLIHPANHNFYETCRSKLGWGSRLT